MTEPVATAEVAARDDDGLVIGASIGDADRFAVVYDRHAASLYRYARGRVGDAAAEDLVAETFLAAFQQRRTYDQANADARPWLFGILTRKISRHHRQEKTHYRALERSPVDRWDEASTESVVAEAAAYAARGQLAAAVKRLPRRDRDVLMLIACADLSYEEVAEALSIPVGTVRSRLNRARRRVRAALGGSDPTRVMEDEQ